MMAVLARIGERLYEFPNEPQVVKARELYAQFVGTQDDFETKMENSQLDFSLEL